MGILFLLGLALAASVWTAVEEEKLEVEAARVYCEVCGAELVHGDRVCVICGALSPKHKDFVGPPMMCCLCQEKETCEYYVESEFCWYEVCDCNEDLKNYDEDDVV